MAPTEAAAVQRPGRLPNFLLIGATKAGSSSLHAYLCGHRDVMMHPQKELRYFTAEHNLHRGLAWYREQFAGAGEARAVGEASNAYTRDPVYQGVPARIAATLPGVKLIYLVRDPMARLRSHYRHRLITATEWRDAETAIAQDPSYLAASLYGHQLRTYLDHVGREQILVVRSERLFKTPDDALDEILGFLGVTRDPARPFVPENVTAARPVAPAILRALGRLSIARPRLRRLARRVGASPLGARAARGDAPAFTLSPRAEADLLERFAADQKLLADLAGADAVGDLAPVDANLDPVGGAR